MEGLKGFQGFGRRLRFGARILFAGCRVFFEAVAVFPEGAEGAFVLAAEHDLVALEEVQDVGGIGQGAEGFGLDFAVGEAADGEVAGDEFLDEIRFHTADAAEAVLGIGHLHHEMHFGRSGGLVFGDVGVAEGDEFFGGLVIEERGLGEEPVFQAVAGGAGFAIRGFWTGGFAGVQAPGSELSFRKGALWGLGNGLIRHLETSGRGGSRRLRRGTGSAGGMHSNRKRYFSSRDGTESNRGGHGDEAAGYHTAEHRWLE